MVIVAPPRHAMHALTTYELRDYRRRLESAIAFFDKKTPCRQPGMACKPGLMRCWPSRRTAGSWPMRDYDVTALTDRELDRARRQLAVSLALARPESPTRAPILARIRAIDAELAGRAPRGQRGISLCSCGFGTDDPSWLDGHLFEHPGHYARPRAAR